MMSQNENNAPERIFITSIAAPDGFGVWANEEESDDDIAYVRADVYEAAQKVAANLAKWSCERCGCRFPALKLDEEELANVTVCTSCAIVQSYENDNARSVAEFEERHLADLREELATAQRELTALREQEAHRTERLELILDHLESIHERYGDHEAFPYDTLSKVAQLSDEVALGQVLGASWVDDPPKGWTKKRLATHARGFIHGESKAIGNFPSMVRLIRWTKELLGLTPPAPNEPQEGK
jgi:hypothetical protein